MTTASFVRLPPASARKRVPDQLLAVGLGDERREGRVLGRHIGELVVQREAGDDVHHIAEVDPLLRPKPGLVAQRDALGPLLQGLRLALIGDLEGCHLLFLQPLAHVAQGVFGLVEVDGLRAAAGGRREILSGSIEGEMTPDRIVEPLQPEEDLVRLCGRRGTAAARTAG